MTGTTTKQSNYITIDEYSNQQDQTYRHHDVGHVTVGRQCFQRCFRDVFLFDFAPGSLRFGWGGGGGTSGGGTGGVLLLRFWGLLLLGIHALQQIDVDSKVAGEGSGGIGHDGVPGGSFLCAHAFRDGGFHALSTLLLLRRRRRRQRSGLKIAPSQFGAESQCWEHEEHGGNRGRRGSGTSNGLRTCNRGYQQCNQRTFSFVAPYLSKPSLLLMAAMEEVGESLSLAWLALLESTLPISPLLLRSLSVRCNTLPCLRNFFWLALDL